LTSFGNAVRGELPGMGNNRPDLQIDGNAGGAGAFGEASRIIEKHFVRAHVDEQGREAGEIGVKRGGERISRIGVAEIVARGISDTGAMEHGTAICVGSNGVTSGGKVSPWRVERRGGWERNAGGAQSEHERECKAAASRLPCNDEALRGISRAQKSAVNGDGVIDGGGKRIFRGKAIIRSKNTQPVERKESGDRTMRFRRTGEVSAPVKIEEHSVAWRRAHKAFAGYATEWFGRNLDGGRDLVGIRAKNFASNAIVPYALQSAFDAPFNDPDCKPSLEANRHSLPPRLEL
jgi:hypothetical protein